MTKQFEYEMLLGQVEALTEGETNAVSIMANVAAAIHHERRFWWTGFYLVDGEELVLGPFQGPVACMHIPFGRGVCGAAWQRAETIVVPDVEQFPGHIACSSESRSEIVIPLKDHDGTVRSVLDIDSRDLDAFDGLDRRYLEEIATLVAQRIYG